MPSDEEEKEGLDDVEDLTADVEPFDGAKEETPIESPPKTQESRLSKIKSGTGLAKPKSGLKKPGDQDEADKKENLR